MNYTELNKPGAPISIMRNSFVETPTEELKKEIERLKVQEDEEATALSCTRMELETAYWELSYRGDR